MKARVKMINPNACGANSYEQYESVSELKKYLNEALYYSGEVLLYIECWNLNEVQRYSKCNDVASLVSEAKHYNSILCVLPTHEYN